MRAIKYRQIKDGRIHYWGYIEGEGFVAPMATAEWNGVPSNQFTGLVDKNDREIFEGDILQDGKGQYGLVLWHFNSFLVEWDGQERDHDGHRKIERMTQDSFKDDCFGYGTVIGNIYQDPKLLEAK